MAHRTKAKTKRKAASGSRTAQNARGHSYGSRLGGLNRKRLRFAEAYAKTGNGTNAALTAGYSPATSGSMANRLLKDANVLAAVTKFQERTAQEEMMRDTVSKERLVRRLARIADVDPADLAEWGGQSMSLKDSETVPPEVRKTLQSLSANKRTGAVSFKIADRLKATELLAKMLGYLVEKHEVSSTEPLVKVYLPDNTPKPDDGKD